MHLAYAAAASPATRRYSLAPEPFHRSKQVAVCRATVFFSRILDDHLVARGAPTGVWPGLTHIDLNSGLLRIFWAEFAALKKRSMYISRSNSLPCIRVVMQASIIAGGPHM